MNNSETLTTLGTQDTLDVDKQNITQKTIKHNPKKKKPAGKQFLSLIRPPPSYSYSQDLLDTTMCKKQIT